VPIVRGGYHVALTPHAFALGHDAPVQLRGDSRIQIVFTLYYRIIENGDQGLPWRTIITGYFFALDDADGREIIAFHWHPDQQSHFTAPHLHFGAGAQVGYEDLHKAHVPTGHITQQDVLRFAITDLGVEALIDRDEALRMLTG